MLTGPTSVLVLFFAAVQKRQAKDLKAQNVGVQMSITCPWALTCLAKGNRVSRSSTEVGDAFQIRHVEAGLSAMAGGLRRWRLDDPRRSDGRTSQRRRSLPDWQFRPEGSRY
ncbi:hypothetical protein WA026_005059 [Henosepilachna vigintioctopunctata]|uniref:Uncharacterized protein n=1 Tax=Henosepilachna vigintioctopunctata TaxID=420089 RepID=A0AAW1UTJ2_9CUCU